MTSRARAGTTTDSMVAARAAAVASIGAAVIHLAVTPSHWREWLPAGLFFASMAAFQLIWAVLVWSRPPAVLLAAGIAVNAASAGLWVVSRTMGAPFGPESGEPEVVAAAGICVLLLECYVVMGATWAWYRRETPESVSGLGSGLVLLGANTVMAFAVLLGVASGLQGHDHHRPVEAGTAAVHHEHSGHLAPAAEAPQPQTGPVAHDGHHDHGG